MERVAAARPPRLRRPPAPPGDALSMLARRGLRPSLARPDLPFPPDISSETAYALAERLGQYAFRLFVRGVIQHGDGFTAAETTSYLSAAQAQTFQAHGIGGDLDLLAAGEGKLIYVELMSLPPKHLTNGEITAFFDRVRLVRPDLALFVVDTALRLSDKVVPMLTEELARRSKRRLRPPASRRNCGRSAGISTS